MEKSKLFTKSKTTEPNKYDRTFAQYEGFSVIEKQGKYGFIDKSGNIVCEPKWDYFEWVADGKAVVGKCSKFGVIDLNGDLILDVKWDNIWHTDGMQFIIKEGCKYGFASRYGEIIYKPQWEDVSNLGDPIGFKEKGKWGLLDSYGNLMFSPKWDALLSSHIYNYNLYIEATKNGFGSFILNAKGIPIKELPNKEVEAEIEFGTIDNMKKVWNELYESEYGEIYKKHGGLVRKELWIDPVYPIVYYCFADGDSTLYKSVPQDSIHIYLLINETIEEEPDHPLIGSLNGRYIYYPAQSSILRQLNNQAECCLWSSLKDIELLKTIGLLPADFTFKKQQSNNLGSPAS